MNNHEVIYACTYVEKRVEVDVYETGCQGESRLILSQKEDIQSGSLEDLIERLRLVYGLAMDDLFVPDENGKIFRIGFNRLEEEDGNEPTESELELWKRGKEWLYLADYDFLVEKRVVSPINVEEFVAAGIKIH
jgi:hypothetical protein